MAAQYDLDTFFDRVSPAHFIPLKDEQDQYDLLKNSLMLIEIEVFSYCNRQCYFCPNYFIDRHTSNIFLPEETYLSILSQLQEIDYSETITYSRYNEPLSNPVILQRIAQARKYLPYAFLTTNSNGDYVTPLLLKQLADAGLNNLAIQAYFARNEDFTLENITRRIESREKKTGLEFQWTYEPDDICGRKETKLDNMTISIATFNFKQSGISRAELIATSEPFSRKSPCWVPFCHMYIDYNGNVVPCCNIRSDVVNHKNFIIGSVFENSLKSIFSSPKIIMWRARCAQYNGADAAPCKTCEFAVFKYDENSKNKLSKVILNSLATSNKNG
ncbi:MAG: SPASM domain-containing protein [Desulfarculales bacterium]|jgi:radical SAM protein with 4Fe4S-binding SPASM domain|nr:SPASM domain-containing protein [Desulfarculales bacterium]